MQNDPQNQQIIALIDHATDGLDLTPQDKLAILGLYLIALNKKIFEILLGLSTQSQDMQKELHALLEHMYATLGEDKKNVVEKVLEEEKVKALIEIFEQFSKNLPLDKREILEKNLASI